MTGASSSASRAAVGLSGGYRLAAPMFLAALDHLAEALEAEDQHERCEPERGAEHSRGDLLADRERGDLGAVGEDREQQRLLDAESTGGEREHGCNDLNAENEQSVANRPADVERVEQSPVGGEPED